MKYSDQSPVIQAFAVLVAVVAIVGSQLLGWEWGGGQLVPTLIGVAVAGVALAVFFSYWMRS
jgi:uncharacterized membrane protein YgaE (UPF0421/DUF939 family)